MRFDLRSVDVGPVGEKWRWLVDDEPNRLHLDVTIMRDPTRGGACVYEYAGEKGNATDRWVRGVLKALTESTKRLAWGADS